jgi:hypothetical protein
MLLPKPEYRLARHVRACTVDGQVILLDLRRNRYLGVGGTSIDLLAQFIVDWPMDASCANGSDPREGASRWVDTLRDQNMLAPADGPSHVRPALDEALDSVQNDLCAHARHVDWRCLTAIARAAAGAAYWLRHHSLAEITDRVTGLKPARVAWHGADHKADLAIAVTTFERLRPFVFTAHDRCLHDSLSLTRFLAGRRIFPRWVIGVKTRPFAAHSWVQVGHLVLNDLPEHVRRYTPILVV